MTQQTAFSPLMLNGKRLTVKDAEKIASEVMEHATRRSLKCKWDKCGLNYGSIHLLERVSGLENVSCASAHWVKSISDENIFLSWPERSWGSQGLEPYVNITSLFLISCDFSFRSPVRHGTSNAASSNVPPRRTQYTPPCLTY